MKLLKIAPVLLLALVFILTGCAANNPTAGAGVSQEAAYAPEVSHQEMISVSDTTPTADEAAAEVTYITASQAESAALTHAGISTDAALGLRSEFDRDDRVVNYDVDFCFDGYEYDYEISAVTAEVIKVEKEFCDHKHAENTASTVTTENTSTVDYTDAVAAALSHAGAKQDDVLALRTDYDRDDGVYEYEVDFWYDGYYYEYDIKADTLEVIRFEKEPERKPASTSVPKEEKTDTTQSTNKESTETTSSKISRDEAKSIALKHAGVSESSAKRIEVEYDRDDGIYKYEVKFNYNGYEYDYDINAETGEIIWYEREWDD